VSDSLSWRIILAELADRLAGRYNLHLEIDLQILEEIQSQMDRTLTEYGQNHNIAKIAGHSSFWIRKLKPVLHKNTSPIKNLSINEELSVFVGLALCRRFGPRRFKIDPCVLYDWVVSLRTHAHSPHSSTLMFELLTRGFISVNPPR